MDRNSSRQVDSSSKGPQGSLLETRRVVEDVLGSTPAVALVRVALADNNLVAAEDNLEEDTPAAGTGMRNPCPPWRGSSRHTTSIPTKVALQRNSSSMSFL